MRQAQLLEVVDALRTAGRLAGGLDGGQQQGDQDRDDRDHDQKLDQRESPPHCRIHGFSNQGNAGNAFEQEVSRTLCENASEPYVGSFGTVIVSTTKGTCFERTRL